MNVTEITLRKISESSWPRKPLFHFYSSEVESTNSKVNMREIYPDSSYLKGALTLFILFSEIALRHRISNFIFFFFECEICVLLSAILTGPHNYMLLPIFKRESPFART